ncbi:MAG: CapA family protein [Butyricimonas virosa]
MDVVVTGDFAPIYRTASLIKIKNYKLIYNDVLPVLKSADLAISNLETPLTLSDTKIEKTGSVLKALPESVEAIKYGGISLVTLANNHIFDYGEVGLKDTIDVLEANQIAYVGAGDCNKKARKPYVFEKNNKKLSIFSIAENEWSTTLGNRYGANPLNEIENYYDIVTAKKTSDFVLVIVHGGLEYYHLPSPRIKKLFRFFIDVGADAVISHHTHYYSGYEIYKNKPIVYGLGNFIFDLPDEIGDWHKGIIAKIDFKGSNDISLELIPILQNDEKAGVRLANMEQAKLFMQEIERINSIIVDDIKLENEYLNQLHKLEKQYIAYIQPYSNKNLYRLRKLRLIPYDFWTKRKRLFLINIVRCEAHREALLRILEAKK